MRDRIWLLLADTKFKTYCVKFLVSKYQVRDRNINILLAVASSSSIAAWAIWQTFPFVWASVIALSQVIMATRPYLPYFKFVKELNVKGIQLEALNVEIDKLWYKSEHEKITVDEASERYYELRKQVNEILTFGDDMVFKTSKEIQDKASQEAHTFLRNNYTPSLTTN